MKQKLLYIILIIFCAFAWNGKVWGIDWLNDFTSPSAGSSSFYIYHPSTGRFVKAGESGSSAMVGESSASLWNYDSNTRLKSGSYYIRFRTNSAETNQTSTSGLTNYLKATFDYSNGYFQIYHRVSGWQLYYLYATGTTLTDEYRTSTTSGHHEWYLVNSTQYANHTPLVNYETAYNSVVGTYNTSNLPDSFYDLVSGQLDCSWGTATISGNNVNCKYSNYTTWMSSVNKVTNINSSTDAINNWLDTAPAMKSAYETVNSKLNTFASQYTQKTSDPETAKNDLDAAREALEGATDVSGINNATNGMRDFDDAIEFNITQLRVDAEETNAASGPNNSITYESSNPSVIAVINNGTTLKAIAEGTAEITASTSTDNGYYAVSLKKNISVVDKISNNLTIDLSAQDTYVGETIGVEFKNKNNDNPIVPSVSVQSISDINDGSGQVISYSDGVITARNAGTAKITFTQAATAEIKGIQMEFTITVSKIYNYIAIYLGDEQRNSLNMATNSEVDFSCVPISDAKCSYSLSGSAEVAHFNGDKTKIITGDADGTNVWTISQAETFKYEAATTTLRIKVNSIVETESYLHTSLTEENSNYNWYLGVGDDYVVNVNYIPKEIRFKSWCTAGSLNAYVTVTCKDANGSTLKTYKYKLSSTHELKSIDDEEDKLPEGTRQFSFSTTGSMATYISDVYVVRKTYINASPDNIDLGKIYTDKTAKATITVDWGTSNGGDITIEEKNNNPRFSFSPNPIPVTANSNGTSSFTLTYTPSPNVLTPEEATIILSDKFNSKELKIKAQAKKYLVTIDRGNNKEDKTTVEGDIANAFAFTFEYPYPDENAPLPSANEAADFYYTITHNQTSMVNNDDDDGAVISYNPKTNTVKGLNAGTARLTITQKNTNLYNLTTKSFDFTVSKLTNEVDISLKTTLNVDETATVQLSGGATDNDGAITVTYKEDDISYTNKLQNRDGGFVTYEDGIKGVNAGVGKITVTQAETYKYLSKSKDFPDFTVNKLPQTLTWYYDEIETYIKKDHTLEGNTARSDADASTFENGVIPIVYSSGNTDVITVDESGVLTGVAVGDNIVITASQEGNYKYLPVEPLTLTRQFSVTNKQIPVFTPDDDFSGLSRQIEYSDVATITVADVSSGDDFVITEGDNTNTILDVVRSGGTITIKGLKVGNTTLTLTQQGNDGYIGRSKTYNIEVFWPDDFLALSPSSKPSSYTAGTYRKVFFNRSFNKGYSTIALPFQTTLYELTGQRSAEDWVAQLSVVTYTAADKNEEDKGYKLYFKKTGHGADADGGIIEANKPYVLHLSKVVENPVWTNLQVKSPSSSSVVQADKGYADNGYGDYSDWRMHANYEPGESMVGKYGIVNNSHLADDPDPEHPGESEKTRFPDGCLKLGGNGSTLNAFMAYIEGPTSAPVKAAYLEDENDNADGLLEALRGEEVSGTESVYDLQGRKLPKAQRGLNIIRGADGVVRKVMNN